MRLEIRYNWASKTLWALLTTLFLWSSSLIGIRIGLESFDAGSLALLRFLIASLCMLFFWLRSGKRASLNVREAIRIMLLGVVGFTFYNVALNLGEQTVDAGAASFILSQIPVMIVILAIIFLQERLNSIGWLGISISFIGIILVALGKSMSAETGVTFNVGILYLLIAALCHAVYSILNKPFLRKINPIEFTTYAMWGGTIALLYYSVPLSHEITHASLSAILAAIYIGIFPAAIGYITWSYALTHLPASKVASVLYALPLLTSVLSWIILAEIPSSLTLIGGAIALIGAMVTAKGKVGSHESPKLLITPKTIG